MSEGCGIQFYCENGVVNDGEDSKFDFAENQPNFTQVLEFAMEMAWKVKIYPGSIFEFFFLNCLIFGAYGCFIASLKKTTFPRVLLMEIVTILIFFYPVSTAWKLLGLIISSCFLCWKRSCWTAISTRRLILPAVEMSDNPKDEFQLTNQAKEVGGGRLTDQIRQILGNLRMPAIFVA